MLNLQEQYPDFFIVYVWDFYSPDSDLYPIKGLTKGHIYDALVVYLERIKVASTNNNRWFNVTYEWGDGDSLDRERVRDIILDNPQFTWSH